MNDRSGFMHELDGQENLGLPVVPTDYPTVCSFVAGASLQPKRFRSLMTVAAFSGNMCSHPETPVWILFRTSREKMSMIAASKPTIGAM